MNKHKIVMKMTVCKLIVDIIPYRMSNIFFFVSPFLFLYYLVVFFFSFNLTEKYFVKFRYCISESNLYKCKQPKCISVFAYLNKAC